MAEWRFYMAHKKNIWLLGLVTAAIFLNLTIWTFAASDDRSYTAFQNQEELEFKGWLVGYDEEAQ